MRDDAFPQVPDSQLEPPRRGTYLDVIFGVMAILASLFSAYTTYKGFSHDFPQAVAVGAAALIGLGLIGVNFTLRAARRNGDSFIGILIFFCVVFVFSFVSNTNAIYTFFVERTIVEATQEAAWSVFGSETERIGQKLIELPALIEYRETKKKLEIARQDYRTQILDPLNTGKGPIARRHLDEVNRILELQPTPLKPPPENAPIEEFREYADKEESRINELFDAKFKDDPGRRIEDLLSDMAGRAEFYERKVASKEYSSDITDMMRRNLESIESKANALGAQVTAAPINSAADEIGSFADTWRNFVAGVNPMAITLSVLLGAFLDILAPLMAIALYSDQRAY